MSIISKIFSKNKYNRKIYAIREGTHKGNFYVYISSDDNNINFLSLPFNTPVSMKIEEFEKGLEKKLVDYIRKLPHNVYEICVAQYNETKTKDDINRLKQPTAQSSMDNGEHPDKP